MRVSSLLKYIDQLTVRKLALVIFLVAVASSLSFSILVYPRIAPSLNSTIAEDGYDKLAYGLYHLGTLTYYPSESPTVLRGPLYPAFVAGLLFAGEPFYPQVVQWVQALVHGATAVLCFAIGIMLWNSRRGPLAGALLCAIHPFLLWYSARIVTETLATFLFTGFVTALLWYGLRPATSRAGIVGLLGGTASLCKQTFLPLPLLLALFLLLGKRHGRALRHPLVLAGATLMVVLPWTIRNYSVSEKIVPIHTLVGFNFRVGDAIAEHYFEAPLSYMKLIAIGSPHILSWGDTVTQKTLHESEHRGDFGLDDRILEESTKRYLADPMFFLRKVVLNSIMFWSISGSPVATIVTTLLQVPLLILTVRGGRRVIQRYGIGSVAALPLMLMVFYVLSHLPIYALARFGLVLVPTMIAYAVGFWITTPLQQQEPKR